MLYTNKTKAQYYDCDINNRLKISSAMQYMQQTSSEQMEHVGISPGKLMQEDLVFLLSQSAIKIHRMPQAAEAINIITAATAFRGARFVREFAVETLAGERLLSASTLWLLVRPSDRKIIRPADFPYDIVLENSFVPEEISKISIPKKPENIEPHKMTIPIYYSHLDCNRHVNNGMYGDFVCDMIDYNDMSTRGIDTIVVKFQNEAKLGDNIEIARYNLTNEEYYIDGKHSRANCFQAFLRLK